MRVNTSPGLTGRLCSLLCGVLVLSASLTVRGNGVASPRATYLPNSTVAGGTVLAPPVVVSAPGQPIVDPSSGHTFVPSGTTRLVMLDTTTGRLLHTAVVSHLGKVALDSARKRLYLLNDYRVVDAAGFLALRGQPSSLIVLDTVSGAVVCTIPVSGTSLLVDAFSGNLYVSDDGFQNSNGNYVGRGAVSILSGSDGHLVRTLGSLVPPLSMVSDQRSRRVFVLSGAAVLYTLEAASGRVLGRRPVPRYDADFSYLIADQRAQRVLVASREDSYISLFDDSTGVNTLARSMLEEYAASVAADEQTGDLIVALDSGHPGFHLGVSILDGRTGQLRRSLFPSDYYDNTGFTNLYAIVALDSVRGRVFITGGDIPSVLLVAVPADTIVAAPAIGRPISPVVLDPPSGTAFVITAWWAHGQHRRAVQAIREATGRVTTLTTSATPQELAVDVPRRRLIVTDARANTVRVLVLAPVP